MSFNFASSSFGDASFGSSPPPPAPAKPAPPATKPASNAKSTKPKLKGWQIGLIVAGVLAVIGIVVAVVLTINMGGSSPNTTNAGNAGSFTSITVEDNQSNMQPKSNLVPGSTVNLTYQSSKNVASVNWFYIDNLSKDKIEIAKNQGSTKIQWQVPASLYRASIDFIVENANNPSETLTSQDAFTVQPPLTIISGIGASAGTSVLEGSVGSIVLNWAGVAQSPVADATFQLEFSASPNFAAPVIVQTSVTSTIANGRNTLSFTVDAGDLTQNSPFYWRYTSTNAVQRGLDHEIYVDSLKFTVTKSTCASASTFTLCNLQVVDAASGHNQAQLQGDQKVKFQWTYGSTVPPTTPTLTYSYTFNGSESTATGVGSLTTDTTKRIMTATWTIPTQSTLITTASFSVEYKAGAFDQTIVSSDPYTVVPAFSPLDDFPYSQHNKWTVRRPSAGGPSNILGPWAYSSPRGSDRAYPGFSLLDGAANSSVSDIQLGYSSDDTGKTTPEAWSPIGECPIQSVGSSGVRFLANVHWYNLLPGITNSTRVNFEVKGFMWLRYKLSSNVINVALAPITWIVKALSVPTQTVLNKQDDGNNLRMKQCVGGCGCRTSDTNLYADASDSLQVYTIFDKAVGTPASGLYAAGNPDDDNKPYSTVIGVYDASTWESNGSYVYKFLKPGYYNSDEVSRYYEVEAATRSDDITSFDLVIYGPAAGLSASKQPWGIFYQDPNCTPGGGNGPYGFLEGFDCSGFTVILTNMQNCIVEDYGANGMANFAFNQSIYYDWDASGSFLRSDVE